MGLRTRRSIQSLVHMHAHGYVIPLENLIKAFRKIQALPSRHPDSFESIAGYHGEPFHDNPSRGEKDTEDTYWGGWCQHGTILFPTWHRAMLLRLERALQDHGPDPDLALPFWDECANVDDSNPKQPRAPMVPIPRIFTSPTLDFMVDGSTANPLYSYTLQRRVVDNESSLDADRYTKPAGYATARYPMSGLVGNSEDVKSTHDHNQKMDTTYPTPDDKAVILNLNVKAWLEGTVQIDPTGTDSTTKVPDTYSVYSRYLRCLDARSYPLFSNNSTMRAWLHEWTSTWPEYVEDFLMDLSPALESPHNAIHLSLGGFFQKGDYNADPILGANGDMGDNNTAAFDPIFYFHHCFVDYMFWQWQKRNNQTSKIYCKSPHKGQEKKYPGFRSPGIPGLPKNTALNFKTPLRPIQKPNSTQIYTSNDVIDIENQLGYTYEDGSFTDKARVKGGYMRAPNDPVKKLLHVHGIDKRKVSGSFVIRTYVDNKDGKPVEIGRAEILSRYQLEHCANCQNNLLTGDVIPLHESTLKLLEADKKDLNELNVRTFLHTRDNVWPPTHDKLQSPHENFQVHLTDVSSPTHKDLQSPPEKTT